MEQGARDELISWLAEAIRSITTVHPLRVAIDGPPAAGKTMLADELAVVLRAQDRDVIRATIDDFLFPRAQRCRRGQYSAEGCYFDAHDHSALCRVLLDPVGPGGDRRFQHAVYDGDTDIPSSPPAPRTHRPAGRLGVARGLRVVMALAPMRLCGCRGRGRAPVAGRCRVPAGCGRRR
ncbi:uridine kinase [Nonomuraea pusilla]|uniref:Uridine kinase n=1 Tax=Nonomuraea pusilla TaxID=46177 RepID=A0A1H7G6U3_9ACTN|nr:uridine kinase [Nonomuraea pusilla]